MAEDKVLGRWVTSRRLTIGALYPNEEVGTANDADVREWMALCSRILVERVSLETDELKIVILSHQRYPRHPRFFNAGFRADASHPTSDAPFRRFIIPSSLPGRHGGRPSRTQIEIAIAIAIEIAPPFIPTSDFRLLNSDLRPPSGVRWRGDYDYD